MKNDFTIEEIKNSVEYQWRKSQVFLYFKIWLIIAVVTLICFIFRIVIHFQLFALEILIWICFVGVEGLICSFFSLYYYRKMRYILKNYQTFNSYEVVLDKPSNSFAYNRAVYYTVTVNEGSFPKKVDTNPYFSSAFFARFTLEDFNNKKVVGLYDDTMDRFYVVKKVG